LRYTLTMTLSEDLTWRGLIKDKTFATLDFVNTPHSFYLGIDPSSDSLTVGNLAVIMLARRLRDAGWNAVLVMGGGTSLVGDPGGKNEERQLMSRETIVANITGVKAQVTKLFSGEQFTMVDNYDWLAELKYLDFLREVGKHFSMTELMQRDFVAERMNEGGNGISYAEFSYSLVQGYDFWHLYKKHDVTMQIGGSDQWGNMLSGVALIRKKEGTEVNALSMPLVINKSTGMKFGKSEDGAVWLDAAKTTPTQFQQFWITTDDANVEEYLKLFTLLSKAEIEKAMTEHRADPSKRAAQTLLADSLTALVHGNTDATAASSITGYLTGELAIADASSDVLTAIRKEMPAVQADALGSVIEALVQSGLSSSNTQARTVLGSGGVYINGKASTREHFEPDDFTNGRLLLRRGKAFKDSALVERRA
jgi:tyrosyl-tRNA synthetase